MIKRKDLKLNEDIVYTKTIEKGNRQELITITVTRTKVNLSEIEEDFTNIGISSSPKIAITKKKIKKEKKADDDGDQSD
jgi:hypothetical protein